MHFISVALELQLDQNLFNSNYFACFHFKSTLQSLFENGKLFFNSVSSEAINKRIETNNYSIVIAPVKPKAEEIFDTRRFNSQGEAQKSSTRSASKALKGACPRCGKVMKNYKDHYILACQNEQKRQTKKAAETLINFK